jgi:2-polyprenyl-6-methoxyphenol hydroxylase-like FAD-dependent oxidoreductase
MRGRVVHLPGGGLGTHPYGTNDDQILRSVLRHDLNAALLDAADAAPNVTLRFDAKLAALACGDTDTRAEPRFDTPAGPVSVPADTVVGADGAFSTVRTWMQRGEPADYHQEFLPFVMRPTAASIPVNPSQPALILARGPDTRPTSQDQPGSSCPGPPPFLTCAGCYRFLVITDDTTDPGMRRLSSCGQGPAHLARSGARDPSDLTWLVQPGGYRSSSRTASRASFTTPAALSRRS